MKKTKILLIFIFAVILLNFPIEKFNNISNLNNLTLNAKKISKSETINKFIFSKIQKNLLLSKKIYYFTEVYYDLKVKYEKKILRPKQNEIDPFRTKNDKIFGKLINNDEKVNFVPNTSENRLFLFSDGPEEIKSLNTQALLKYYENNKEHSIPVNKLIDFEFYHYNSTVKDYIKNIINIGVIVKNENSEKPAQLTIYGSTYDIMKIPKTEDSKEFENEALRIKEDEKRKSIMCADMQMNFLNNVKKEPEYERVINLEPGEIKFIMNVELPYYSRINGRIRMKCDSENVFARVVSAKYEEDIHTTWENSTDDVGKSSKGQFCGIVDYTEIDVNIKNMENGEYILIGNYDRRKKDNINYPDSYEKNEVFYSNQYNEYPSPIYRKEDGKEYFFGNFGVVYNIKLENPESKVFKAYLFGHNVGEYSNIVLYDNNWYTTGEIEKQNEFTSFNSGFILSQSENEIKFVLPGGNCGGIKFKMIPCKDSKFKELIFKRLYYIL